MHHVRERHNAKARQSTAGQRKKGKSKASKSILSEQTQDSNAQILVPKSEEQRESDRRDRLREQLLAQSESKVNSKKKKRLDKYIDKKLKQEERIVLLDKLSKSQAQGSNALTLLSSSTLGTGRVSTHQQRAEKEEHHQMKRVLGNGLQGKRKRDSNIYTAGAQDSESDDAETFGVTRSAADTPSGETKETAVVIVDDGFSTRPISAVPDLPTSAVGSALKASNKHVTEPHTTNRSKTLKLFGSWQGTQPPKSAHDSDESFDSSDSAYDSSEDDESASSSTSGDKLHASDREDAPAEPAPKRRLNFKTWALQQLNAVKGYATPKSPDPEVDPHTPEQDSQPRLEPPPKKRKVETSGPREMRGPLGEDISLPATALAKHLEETARRPRAMSAKTVVVHRPVEVEETRLLLPIVAEEQTIMEAVLLHNVVVICGETGSGKTTQVPQFLYEAGFGSPGSDNPGIIGVTQPRRVAAMSMASRVAHELSLTSSKVSYQIRYDATVSPNTSIKFMTDGVLLRELATDFLLKKYSVIIIDEAHERSMNTDILIGVLSRVIKLREEMWLENKDGVKPLRLIIMSATLRVSDFAENSILFPTPPPIIHVPARQHPVTVHFSRKTRGDYVTDAIRKASKIHTRLPPGGILIFLTGQNEITGVCRKLEEAYGVNALKAKKKRRVNGLPGALGPEQHRTLDVTDKKVQVLAAQADIEAEDMDFGSERADLAADVDGDLVDSDDDDDDVDGIDDELGIETEEVDTPMHIVPLYALLSNEKQMQVFKPPPDGCRLVVVSTNVAETSLTIPGIRYVIDCGRAKERRYDAVSGVQAFQVSWISKASASQRAGRAGRTGPGHCYRLYSSALFEDYFEKFAKPEILRMPIEGVVLQMKSMHIDAVSNFPFPTPPDRHSLRKAEILLTHLGALTAVEEPKVAQITEVGRIMSLFPLSPRFSRMLVSGRQHECLPYVISIVAALSIGDPFLREEAIHDEPTDDEEDIDESSKDKEERKKRRKAFYESQETHASLGDHSSDLFRLLSVVGAYEYAGGGHQFCADHFVRPKAMEEIHKLRAQISSIVQANFPDCNPGFVANLPPPNALQLKVLRQLITAGFIDQVAVRKDKLSKDNARGQQFTTSRDVSYCAMGIEEDVYIHPSSVLATVAPPEYIVYHEIVRTTKAWAKGVTSINATWLSSLGKSLCTFSKPIPGREGVAVVIPHFGPGGWELPPVKAN